MPTITSLIKKACEELGYRSSGEAVRQRAIRLQREHSLRYIKSQVKRYERGEIAQPWGVDHEVQLLKTFDISLQMVYIVRKKEQRRIGKVHDLRSYSGQPARDMRKAA